jgi:hypothetical protein
MFINTDPPYYAPAGVAISGNEGGGLPSDCFVDTGMIQQFSMEHILDLVSRVPNRVKGCLPAAALVRIRDACRRSGLLTVQQLTIIEDNIRD